MLNKTRMDLFEHHKRYAINCHKNTNHLYDRKSYEVHLEMVSNIANKFSFLINNEDWWNVKSSVYCHDVIEDTRQTFNDIVQRTNYKVAIIVYALTNEKGKTRKERANSKYYRGIRKTKYATFVKLCDRIANVTYSKENSRDRMFEVYKKENPKFVNYLKKSLIEKWFYPEPNYKVMFDHLNNLFV